ncbi:MAG: tetratricopeptide repeat protein [Desulfobacterales bacterium]|nr:tetratricopeptide repeat protein [Desulfobacterales bacterium]
MKTYFQRAVSIAVLISCIAVLIPCIVSCANLEEKKNRSEAVRNVGEAYIREERYTAALKELLKAEKVYDKDHFLQNDLGFAYMGKEKPELAVKHFEKAVELAPDFGPARNNLGTAYLALKDWDSAIATLTELTDDILYATPHYPLSNIGWAHYNKGEYKLSEKYYKESLKKRPDFVLALRGLGKTYLATGKFSDAVKYFEKAVENTHPHAKINPELYFDMARAYRLSNNRKKAFDAYRKVIALEPESDLAREAEKELEKMKK